MKIAAWLSKMLVSAILISTISVVTTAYIVNSYITQLLKPLNLQISQKPLGISDILANLWGTSNIVGQEGAAGNETNTEADRASAGTSQVGKEDSVEAWAQTGSGTGNTGTMGSAGSTGSSGSAGTSGASGTSGISGSSSSSGADSSRATDKAMVMSEEQFQDKKEQLSDEDKLVIFTALSQLPQKDMQTISTLVEDGITSSELAEVEKIVEQHLKPEEYKQLLEILEKYE